MHIFSQTIRRDFTLLTKDTAGWMHMKYIVIQANIAPVRSYLWCILQKLLQCQHSTATWNPPGQPWGFWFQSQLHWTWPSLQSELEIFVQGTRLADSVCCLISSFLVFNVISERVVCCSWLGLSRAGDGAGRRSQKPGQLLLVDPQQLACLLSQRGQDCGQGIWRRRRVDGWLPADSRLR